MRIGLRTALQRIPGVHIIGEAGDGLSAVELARQLHPAIIFMDISMPHLDGIQATKRIKASQPDTRIIMFTSNEVKADFLAALSAGADGYCLKDANEQQLASAINAVMQGATWLDSSIASHALRNQKESEKTSERLPSDFSTEQRQILELVATGLDLNQIAKALSKPITELKLQLKVTIEKLRTTQDEPNSANGTHERLEKVLENDKNKMSNEPHSFLESGFIFEKKFVIEDVIGEGGMSVVYRARNLFMNKVVALKLLHFHLLDNAMLVQRLQNEARAAGSISHPNIVAVHDFAITANGQPYLVMDYVDGETLAEMHIRESILPLTLTLEILIQVCDALVKLHSNGIIHRDLKLSNIMIIKDNGKLVAKLLDFGIVKVLSGTKLDRALDVRPAVESDLTVAGEVFGSPAYMSPEQCRGEPVDERSDLYSLGCVLYQLVTGNAPFRSPEPLNVMWQQVHELPTSVPFLNCKVPIQLRTAIFQLLHKDPDMRLQSADRLKFELETILNTIRLQMQATKT